MSKIVKKTLIKNLGAVSQFEFVSEVKSGSIIQPFFDYQKTPQKTPQITPHFPSSLDKLAQLSPKEPKKPKGPLSAKPIGTHDIKEKPPSEVSGIAKLEKRARAKYFTCAYLPPLIDLDSPLKKSYSNSLFCCQIIHQKDDKFTSRYCNNRFCTVCNRIRIAKAINGYLPQMREFKDPYFMTLTKPTVKSYELKESIHKMIYNWRLIYKCLKKRKIEVKGIRKLECTYRPVPDKYHAHFHMIVDGKELADAIKSEWLIRYPKAAWKPQHIIKADEGSMLELFKYFTKIISKEKLYIPALDTIFQAMSGLRTFQPFGVKKISEEVDELQTEIIDDVIKREVFWEWMNHDWIDKGTNQNLTGFKPSKEIEKLIQNIIY